MNGPFASGPRLISALMGDQGGASLFFARNADGTAEHRRVYRPVVLRDESDLSEWAEGTEG